MKDYEQKYKEVLSFLKDLKPHMSDYCIEKLEGSFPELKESEDEKMIRIIMKTLQDINKKDDSMMGDILLEDCIAWLEKKGEKKRQMPLVKSVSTDFKDRLGAFMQYTSVDLEKEENKQLLNEAAKELLQLAYSDKANEIALASAKTWEESMAILMAANNAYRRGQKEQKPAWSEEDEKMLSDIDDCINNLPIFYETIKVNGEDKTTEQFVCLARNWLKSIKKRLVTNC